MRADISGEKRVGMPQTADGGVNNCNGCNLCVRQCSFLEKAGNPAEIAAIPSKDCNPFECTLCGLCTAVCPAGVDPARFFLARRRDLRDERGSDDRRHSPLISYERRGTSPLFTFYGLPEGCDTVFFPGCALPGTRPAAVEEVYRRLKELVPGIGIVLDCCLKPSHDLGREEHFHEVFGEMRDYLTGMGIRKVLVACPNCHRIFSEYGGDLSVQTVYELLPAPVAEDGSPGVEVVMHDPCVARFLPTVQQAARSLATGCGATVQEMDHSKALTLCCGRGGGVNFIAPQTLKEAVAKRVAEADGRPIVTYCAACAGTFAGSAKSVHILDIWMSPARALAGQVSAAHAPFTYLNRLRLKRTFSRSGGYTVTRERNLDGNNGRALIKPVAIFTAVVAAVLIARTSGFSALTDPDTLRRVVGGSGALGPLLFVFLYTVTPVLFLPGLPMALAAGILFGPVWGVVYAITGATLGACASFLVARYLARDWVEKKLSGDIWRKLDQQVGEQGWKIVALTRLIPLFPFNLLNYAFGLTKVPFLHYTVTSFFCMLPACIAFIVFSSSLPQLLKGKISPALLLGAAAITVVSLVSSRYRRKLAKDSSSVAPS